VPTKMKDGAISPKAVLAFLYPLIATVIATIADWGISGQFDVTAIRIAAAGLGASLVALLGAYVGRPGEVVKDTAAATLESGKR
jgi:hypothetical protein